MHSREKRLRKIRQIIAKRPIATQEGLRSALDEAGIKVNQATLSRDIRELGLVKTTSNGQSRYASPPTLSPDATPTTTRGSGAGIGRLIRAIDWSDNLVVIKTESGAASLVAEELDHLDQQGILGTIAGDNTIFIAPSRKTKASTLASRLRSLTGLQELDR